MRIDVMGVGFDSLTMEEAVARARDLMAERRAAYVVTPNPEIVMLCREDAAAMQAVQNADLVLADGIGVIYGAKILGTPLRAKLPGIDFASALMSGSEVPVALSPLPTHFATPHSPHSRASSIVASFIASRPRTSTVSSRCG